MSSRHSLHNSSLANGFTLIEMIVSISILLLVLGGGMAAYINFNDKQTLQAATRRVEVILRTAQKRARSGDTPAGCDQLESYSVSIVSGSQTVTTTANCSNTDIITSTETLPSIIVVPSNAQVIFSRGAGGVLGDGVLDFQIEGVAYQVTISSGGGINAVEIEKGK